MAGQGRQIGGLAICLLGIVGVCLACGLPMWRESSFVGANIVSAQTIWDGLWLHCVVQATGMMQCKKPPSINVTSDLEAGRGLTLLSIILGLIGFVITVLGGGVANCSGTPPDNYYSTRRSTSSSTTDSQNKASLLGGLLCVVSGLLCLVAVIWSAALTLYVSNDPLVVPSMKRDVGTSVYVGLTAGLLLLVGGAILCTACTAKRGRLPPPLYRPYLSTAEGYGPRGTPSLYSQPLRMSPPRADVARSSLVFTPAPRTPQYKAGPYDAVRPTDTKPAARNSFQYRVGPMDPRIASLTRSKQPRQGPLVGDTPSMAALLPPEYYYNAQN